MYIRPRPKRILWSGNCDNCSHGPILECCVSNQLPVYFYAGDDGTYPHFNLPLLLIAESVRWSSSLLRLIFNRCPYFVEHTDYGPAVYAISGFLVCVIFPRVPAVDSSRPCFHSLIISLLLIWIRELFLGNQIRLEVSKVRSLCS